MMDLAPALVTYGPLGIGAAALGWAFWQERKRNHDLQDKRVSESHANLEKTIEAINQSTNALNTLAELIRVRIGGS